MKQLILGSLTPLRCKNEATGKMEMQSVCLHYMEDGVLKFNVDVCYAFPINPMKDMHDGGSTTVMRVVCNKDKPVLECYDAIKLFIREHLGLCPAGVCMSLGFYEVIGMEPIDAPAKTN